MTTDTDITTRLEKSLIDNEMKTFWQKKLPTLNEDQKTELLGILKEEEEMVQAELDKANAPTYAKLAKDMKDLANELTREFSEKIEEKDKEDEKNELKALEEELNNL